MTTLRREVRKLTFEIGEHTYEIPPVDDDAGTQLADMLTRTPAEAAKSKVKPVELYKLALTADIWEQMRADGVPFVEMRTAGLAALAHFQVLLRAPNPSSALDAAEAAARGIWEAGIDPEALAANMAATLQPQMSPATKPSTRSGAGSTTRSPSSGTGTRPRKTATKKTASRSRGGNSQRNGH